MAVTETDRLAEIMAGRLAAFSFREKTATGGIEADPGARMWKRKTWNTNRAVALVRMGGNGMNPGEFARSIKMEIGGKLGYLTFFYPLGLQIVLYGRDIPADAHELQKYVDKVDTQTVVLQSIFVVDMRQKRFAEARTWAQYVTGKFQDAVHEAIDRYLRE